MAAQIDAFTPRIPQGINKEDPTRGTTDSPLVAMLPAAGDGSTHDGWMFLTLRQPVWPLMFLTDDALDRLLGQPLPVNISGHTITGTITGVKFRVDAQEVTVDLQLPDDDETVAAFRRVVGVERLSLGRPAGGQVYEELDKILDPKAPEGADPA